MSTLTDDYGAEFVAVTAWPTEPLASTSSCGPSCLRRFAKSDPPTPSIVCRCPQGSQGDLGSAWLAQSGRTDRSLDPEGSTDRFDTPALETAFLKRCNKRCNAFWAFVTV
jgi:hypothetical protein